MQQLNFLFGFLLITSCLFAQSSRSEFDGDVQIRGGLDISSLDDTSSVFIGRNFPDLNPNFELNATAFGADAGSSMSSFAIKNTLMGSQAGSAMSGDNNSVFGALSGQSISGDENSLFGAEAGFSITTGSRNSLFGFQAGLSNVSGGDNSFFRHQSGSLNTASSNSFFGSGAGQNNTSGSSNSFYGRGSGEDNTTGAQNSFFGMNSGRNNESGSLNAFFGTVSGLNNTTASSNAFFGYASGRSTTSGGSNSFFGRDSGKDNTTGNRNAFFGAFSGENNTTGLENSYFGHSAGQGVNDEVGSFNSFFGYRSGELNTSGDENSFLGHDSGHSNTSGTANTFIGKSSGVLNTDGHYNTALGAFSGPVGSSNLEKSIAIGYEAQVACSNCAVVGGVDTNAVKVGIGVDLPEYFLTLFGTDANNQPDFAITSNDAIIELGKGKSGPNALIFGDDDGAGMKLSYRTAVDALRFEQGEVLGTGDVLMTLTNDGLLGIGTAGPNDALDVVGDIDATGCIQTDDSNVVGGTCLSDRRLKKDILPLSNQLGLLMQINPVTYSWKNDQSSGVEIGLIAQELEKILPEMIKTEDDGTKKIKYGIDLQIRMIKALQEQQELIIQQELLIKEYRNELELQIIENRTMIGKLLNHQKIHSKT